jgi:signal transduction histidine kinase/ligand-binding sensor domain-containing protein
MIGRLKTQFKFIHLSSRLVCLLALADCVPIARAFTPGDAPRNPIYSFDVWQVEDIGVPNTVTSILQSHNGYLWMGTYQGLVRFDGVNFTQFDAVHTPGLQNSRITALYEDNAGTLWIGHETGELSRLSGGEFHRVQPGQTWPEGPVEEIETDENNDVWILNEKGVLFRVRDGKRLESPGGLSTTRRGALSREANGRLWMVANGLVSRMEHGELKDFRFPDAAPSDFYERVAPARDGGLWVVGNGRIRKWTGNQWGQDLGECPCGHNHFVSALEETRAGNLLVGTVDDGLYVVEPGAEIHHYSRTNKLSHDWIRGLCEDHEGNIWLGTGAGLNALRARKVRMLEAQDHFQGRAVLSFSVRPDGSAWVGTEGAGLYHYEHNAWTCYTESSGLSNLFVWSVLVTRPGELFVGTWGGGCMLKRGEHFEQAGELSRITAPVVALYEGQEGEVWIGTTTGVYRYQNGNLKFIAGKDEMSFPDVRAIAQSPDGTMWFGLCGGGVARLNGGKLQQFRKGDGLNSDFVQCLYADLDGSLWIGSSDYNGICRWKQGKFGTLSSQQGLPATVICHITDDGAGNLWFSSNPGVFRARKTELEQCAEGQLQAVKCFSFGKAEGMGSLICSGGFQPGTCRTMQGQLWVPTAKGIATIDPANVTLNQAEPPVAIETLLADNQPLMTDIKSGAQSSSEHSEPATVDSNGRLNIPAGKQRFEIRYTALSFAAPEKVRFKYKLEGLEKEWTDAETKRAAPYTYLPPGPYTFRVIACNNDEVWNNVGASLAFYVLPEFWQTWWFKTVVLLAGAGLVAGAVMSWMRRRVRRKLEQLERQRIVERERARIARDIHDDLGASLTHITLLSQSARGELDDGHTAAEDMDQIYTTARELTRAMDEIVWAVNPKHDTLESLVAYLARFAQNFLSGTGLRCRLDVPVQLPAWTLTSEIRHNVFLASKEALNNAVKHAHATEVRLSLELAPSAFVIVVGDNGQGFELQRLNGHPGGGDELRASAGNGLQNMKRRLTEVGGQCEWETAPHEGTRVRMTIQVNGVAASSKEMTGVILHKERR